jgi:hypothetical protein
MALTADGELTLYLAPAHPGFSNSYLRQQIARQQHAKKQQEEEEQQQQ